MGIRIATTTSKLTLAAYRTFIEIDQPERKFVLRMQSGPRVALLEADGGAWKNEAIRNIENYLMEELSEFNETEKLTIIAWLLNMNNKK